MNNGGEDGANGMVVTNAGRDTRDHALPVILD
jgi:hypothetical protein